MVVVPSHRLLNDTAHDGSMDYIQKKQCSKRKYFLMTVNFI